MVEQHEGKEPDSADLATEATLMESDFQRKKRKSSKQSSLLPSLCCLNFFASVYAVFL